MMKPYDGIVEIWEVDHAVGDLGNNQPELMCYSTARHAVVQINSIRASWANGMTTL